MDKELIIVGGGYSVREGIEKDLWNKIKGKTIWSLNFTYQTMPYNPTRQLWVDSKFYVLNMNDLYRMAQEGVELVSRANNKHKHVGEIVTYAASKTVKGIYDKKKDMLFSGGLGLVGVFSLSLAIKEEYNKIYLLGYDFGTPSLQNKKTHYYQDELEVRSGGIRNPNVYLTGKGHGKPKEHVQDFERFLEYGVDIYNVSMITNIPYFTKITYDSFFELTGKKLK